MPRSRSRKKRDSRRTRGVRSSDSVVLLDLLAEFEPDREGRTAGLNHVDDLDDLDESPHTDLLLLDAFDRAAWSFYAGPGPEYAGPGSMERGLAQLRAREWFLFELELPSGLTAAEEWFAQREAEPGSGAERRAIRRFVNSECGVFDVREIRRDGSMALVPLDGGEVLRVKTIANAIEMIPGVNPSLPVFTAGDTIAGRLYWQDDRTADLSAGASILGPEARAHLLADPPPPGELRSGLALEAALGADASLLLRRAVDPCFPILVDSLLSALSFGTFDYRRLWRELEGEGDPVAVARQLLAELGAGAWTDIEPQLLAWAVAGTWLRRREAAADRKVTADAFARERRALEEHVRTVLDVPVEPGWPPRTAAAPLAIGDDETFASIEQLEVEEVEWIVDVLPDPLRWQEPPTFAPSRLAPACLIVEQPTIPLERLEDEDEEVDAEEVYEEETDEEEMDEEQVDEEEVDEDVEEVEPGDEPLVLQQVYLGEGEDEAAVALAALVETLLAEGRETRPQRIVFRQRALAARLAETLQDAGMDVELRYFDEAVEVATTDIPPGVGTALQGRSAVGPPREVGTPHRGVRSADVATEAERLAYARLVDAARRAEDGLQVLAANTATLGDVALVVTLAQPLACPFATLEGVEERVGSMAVIAESESGDLRLRIHPAAPGEASRFDCRGPSGELLIGIGDSLQIEIERAGEDGLPAPMRGAGLVPSGEDGRTVVVPLRYRDDRPPELLRGGDLETAAGLMEAVADAAARIAEEGAEDGSIEAHVAPLGDVKVAWRGWL